jgi:hypothetical protein
VTWRDQIIDGRLHELSPIQAQAVLDAFLETEADTFRTLRIGSIDLDYSQESVVAALGFILDEIRTGRLEKREQSVWFVRLGYYFGESLRRGRSELRWGLGNPEYAFCNHPAIVGFPRSEEAEVIAICHNIIMSVADGLSPDSRIENGVRFWFEEIHE